MSTKIKFRLRLDEEIVGYEKWYPGERCEGTRPGEFYWRANPCWLYSKNGINWTPTLIFHNHKDRFTGKQDRKGKDIYEQDKLVIKGVLDTSFIEGTVEWNELFLAFTCFQNLTSYSFKNAEIME